MPVSHLTVRNVQPTFMQDFVMSRIMEIILGQSDKLNLGVAEEACLETTSP